MEILSYELRIDVDEKYYDEVSSIIGLYPDSFKFGWSYEILFEENKENYNAMNKFLDSLEGKYDHLNELGVESRNITIWIVYGYNNQCNMEFEPSLLYRLGKCGVKLCISCYEAGS
ncbi:MAG: hypothetical protein K0M40_03410 [Prolixibacteraceae bacterium]|nr:hypothetical protein [Prolixibacteraceae bacterium]